MPLVRVVPDAVYPDLWRIIWPDDRVSELANISRIKDAAVVICTNGPPPRNPQRLHWELDRSNSPSEAPRSTRRDLPGGHHWERASEADRDRFVRRHLVMVGNSMDRVTR